ncbi:hypothetical protein LOAG_05424 [Loa loa]|uniref:Uncharacterized protein n=2 Tax=Loa loa TaxID=7209 RepID=A0A1S0U0J4_LOALO|nr:hypothetical protein LOAG_05424 [Loa loa]EFO23058.1 hypothetical protein LOAG_05424 [Loa loa]
MVIQRDDFLLRSGADHWPPELPKTRNTRTGRFSKGMFREVLSRYAPGLPIAQQVSRRLFAAEANLQHPADTSSQPSLDRPNEQMTSTVSRRNINRVCLSGTVTGKPFYGTTKNGGKFGIVRITSNSFGGQYDFRVRLGTRTSLAYCRENVDEGSHLFVFGRLATFPRAAADGTQGSSGTVMASRISVESNSAAAAVNENEQFDDIDLSAEEDLEQSETKK